MTGLITNSSPDPLDNLQQVFRPQPGGDQNVSKLREDLQQRVVNIITKKLESGEMNEDRAKAIAKLTLDKLPENISYEDFMKVVPTLDDEFEELRTAIMPLLIEYQSKVASQVQQQVSQFMKQGKYSEALKLARQAIEFEKQLT